jgi:multicomponent Na+:H+ antiporter subunit D
MLALAAATMLVGTLGALVQDDLHRVLSFTLVGHIGYMLFGLSLYSVAGLTGAILYLVHHIVVQATLFLVSDIMQAQTGETSLHRLGGLASSAAFTAALFFVPAMSVSGVPPLSGFVAKLALFQAGIGAGVSGAMVTAVALLTGLLTLLAMSRVWALAFWRPPPSDAGPRPHTTNGAGLRLMRVVTAAMVACGLGIALLAGPLSDWSRDAAADLLDRTAYRNAVLQAAP